MRRTARRHARGPPLPPRTSSAPRVRASADVLDHGRDIADLLDALRDKGCSPKTSANALATLQGIIGFARRHGWITTDPVDQLESHERPRPARRCQRVLGRCEIERLLAACAARDRLMVATALYTGLRISELLGLIWDDVDFAAGLVTSARSSHARIAASRPDVWRRRQPPRSATSRLSPSSAGRSRLTGWRRRSRPGPTGCSLPRAARPSDIETRRGAA